MASFPPCPVATVDWTMKTAKVHEVNGHVESTYSVVTGKWSPLKFVSDPYIRIHGLAPGLNYGQQVLEGLKAFRLPDSSGGGISIFRPDRNAKRFQHSAEVLSIPIVPTEMFIQACCAAVAANADYVPPHESGGGLYIRPQLYGSSAHLGLTPPDEYRFCVFVVPTGVNDGTSLVKALILEDFDRTAPKGTGHAKVGGNYAPTLRWSQQARDMGFGLTLHLDSAQHEMVDEFSTCGFLGVHSHEDGDNGVTILVPDSRCIINSVTSESIQHLARSYGWKVEKRPVKYLELPRLTEVLGAGTSVSLVPIQSITRRRTSGQFLPKSPRVQVNGDFETVTYISNEQRNGGPVYQKLLAHLRGIQLGTLQDDLGWRIDVHAEDQEVLTGHLIGSSKP